MIAIDQLADIRRAVEHVLSWVEPEDLFRIPAGFVNHIGWNAAHIVVTQQNLCYNLSGVTPHVPAELIAKYRKGTGPGDGDAASYHRVMEYLHKGHELLAEDYGNGRFESYTPYSTSAGIKLETIQDAITFNNFHEGVHIGYIMALRKALA